MNSTTQYLKEELNRCQKNIAEVRTKLCEAYDGETVCKLTLSLNYWLRYEEQILLELRSV